MRLVPRRLRTQVILLVSCILLATGIVSGWVNARNQSEALMASMRAHASSMTRSLAEGCAHYLVLDEYAGLETLLLGSLSEPGVLRLQVIEPDGLVIGDVENGADGTPRRVRGPVQLAPPPSPSWTVGDESGALTAWQPIEAGSHLGWIKATYDLAGIRKTQAETWQNSLRLSLLWVAGSTALLLLVLRPLVRAIGSLATFARNLDEHKGAQTAAGFRAAEIEELGESLNYASSRLLATERDLIHERETLAEQHSTLRGIIDSVDALIFSVDRQYRYTSFNAAYATAMGAIYGTEVRVGKSLLECVTVAADRDTTKRNLDRALAGERQVQSTRSGDDATLRRFFEVSHHPIAAGDGTVIGVAVLSRDVTEQKLTEARMANLNQELERRVLERTAALEAANKELEAFAYSVSHDLRAPLRHIDGFIELLRSRVEHALDAEGQHYMERISEAAVRMGRLIDDLLSFSRMGRAELASGRVSLADLVREAAGELRPEAAGRDVRWRVGELPTVTGDRNLLRTVFVNLLANALKFTRTRQRAEIEVGWRAGERGETVVFVRDNGVGFDPTYTGRLFGVFQRLHRAEEFEGTGIGLASVRRIVSRHGGRTWAEGDVDKGATFYFSLPASPTED